jgi:hypothetical protein
VGEAAVAERQDGEPDEATIHGWLVDHYSHVSKLTQPRIRVLLGLRDQYPYLRAPAVTNIYRGLSNVSPGVAGKLVGESDPTVDKSWTTSLEQATKFATGEYIKAGDIDPERVGSIMHGKVDPEQLLLDADAVAQLDAVAGSIHPVWNEPLRQSILDEREVVVLGPVDVERVEVIPMLGRQDYDDNTMCVVLPIPPELAALFPEDEQRGRPHVTMIYVGPGSEVEFENTVKLTSEALAGIAGEQVELGAPDHGPLGDGEQQVIYANANVSDAVVQTQGALLDGLKAAGIEPRHRPGPWLPHATVAYRELGSTFDGQLPTGSWPIDSLEVWRGDQRAIISKDRIDRLTNLNGKWQVQSTAGEELGEFDTEDQARERLRQIEAGKAARADGRPRAPAVHTLSRNLIEVLRTDKATILPVGLVDAAGRPVERADGVDYTEKLVGGLEPATKLDNGWWRVPVLYSVGGNVQEYPWGSEYRPYEEVTHPRSMGSGPGCPWELLHSERLLTPQTVLGRAGGVVQSVWAHPDGIHTCGHSIIWDGDLLEAISGERPLAGDVSVAFRAQLDKRSGTAPDGQKFGAIQLMPIWNSVAAEPVGRAETARVLMPERLDGNDQLITSREAMLRFARQPNSKPVYFLRTNWERFDSATPPQEARMHPLIQALLAQAKTTPADLATALGIAEADLTKMLDGSAEMPPEMVPLFIEAIEGMGPDEAEPTADAATPAAPAASTTKIKIGDKEVEVPAEVAAHIATLVEQAAIAGERADRADAGRTQVAAKLSALEASHGDMVPRADAERMAMDGALDYAQVIALARQTNPPKLDEHGKVIEFSPEPRMDASGKPLPLSKLDWQRAAISAAYGDDAPAILERIDSADPSTRETIIRLRIEDAQRGRVENRSHTHREQEASIARMRAEHSRQDGERAAALGSGSNELSQARDEAEAAGQKVIGRS